MCVLLYCCCGARCDVFFMSRRSSCACCSSNWTLYLLPSYLYHTPVNCLISDRIDSLFWWPRAGFQANELLVHLCIILLYVTWGHHYHNRHTSKLSKFRESDRCYWKRDVYTKKIIPMIPAAIFQYRSLWVRIFTKKIQTWQKKNDKKKRENIFLNGCWAKIGSRKTQRNCLIRSGEIPGPRQTSIANPTTAS